MSTYPLFSINCGTFRLTNETIPLKLNKIDVRSRHTKYCVDYVHIIYKLKD